MRFRVIVDSTCFGLGRKRGERKIFWSWYKSKTICALYFRFVLSPENFLLPRFFPRTTESGIDNTRFSRIKRTTEEKAEVPITRSPDLRSPDLPTWSRYPDYKGNPGLTKARYLPDPNCLESYFTPSNPTLQSWNSSLHPRTTASNLRGP